MRFYLKKIGFYLVALFAALTLNFAIPRLMPGDPVSAVLTRLASRGGTVAPETREAITAMLGRISPTKLQRPLLLHCLGPFVLSAQPRLYRSLFNRLLVSGLVGVVVALLITSFPLCPPFSKLFLTSGLHSSSFGCLPVRCIGSLSQADTIIVRLCPASLGNSSRAQCSMQSCRP